MDTFPGRDKAVAQATASSTTEVIRTSGDAGLPSTAKADHGGVDSWLTELGLATYADQFASQGYTNLSQVQEVERNGCTYCCHVSDFENGIEYG